MDWTGWAIGLGLVGAGMELAGVILALQEIRHRAQRLTDYQRALHTVGKSVTLGFAIEVDAAGEVTGPPPTNEQRLESLEARVKAIPDEIRQAQKTATDDAVKAAQQHTDNTAKEIRGEVQRATELLVGSLSGHRRAYASITLLVGGLIVQAVAGVFGNLG